MKFKIKKNDEVIIITGAHKGKTGRVLNINKKQQTVTVDKINIRKKHTKPSQTNPDGGIKEFEGPIHISNVAVYSKETKKEIKAREKEQAKAIKTEEKELKAEAKEEVKEEN